MLTAKFKLAICQEGFAGWSFDQICSYCSSIGYEGIELAPYIFADDVRLVTSKERDTITTIAKAHGISITGLHWLLVKPDGLHLTHPDQNTRAKTIDYLKALCDFCADVGGNVLTYGSPKSRNVLPGVDYKQAWDYAIDGLRQVGEHAYKQKVTLCLESLPAQDTNFLTTAEEVKSLVLAVNTPGIAMMLDVKSMCSEGQDNIPTIIRKCHELVEHIHVNDANRKGPGYGTVDFTPILQTLVEVGYDKWVSVEAFDFSPSPQEVAKGSIEYLKGCL